MSAHSHKNCTIRDLAKYVGMSTCTVSKVLNDREGKLRIAPETRRIIQEAARKLHYAPNVNAQRLFRKRSNVIGFLVPPCQDESDNPVFLDQHLALILGSISNKLQDTDYNLMMLFNNQKDKQCGRYESMFHSHLLDGLFIWGIKSDDFYWNELTSMRTPTLFLTTTPERESAGEVNYITSDFEHAAYSVTCHLFNQGCRAPLWLNPGQETSVTQEETNGILRAFREYSIPCEALQTLPCNYASLDLPKFFQAVAHADGIIAPADNITRLLLGIMPALQRQIPIVCLDCTPHTVVPGIPSMVSQDKIIGEEAVKAMLQMIENPSSSSFIQKKIPGVPAAFK